MNPFVFIVGCPRSGTTLLRRIVDAHRDVAMTPETHWIPRCYEKRKGVREDGSVEPALLDFLLANPRFKKLAIGEAVLRGLLPDGEKIQYADFVSRIFDLYGRARGKHLTGDKTPAYVRHIPTLHTLWPKARFVHLIRDGRDVCLSTVAWKRREPKLRARYSTWASDPVTTAALQWERSVCAGCGAGRALGRQLYYEVRYERLVTDPENEARKLCAFLEVPYDERMPRFHEGRVRPEPGLSARKAWLPPTPGLRDWRSQMDAADLERFEAAAGDLLAELGYDPATGSPTQELIEHTSHVREAFERDVSPTRRGATRIAS